MCYNDDICCSVRWRGTAEHTAAPFASDGTGCISLYFKEDFHGNHQHPSRAAAYQAWYQCRQHFSAIGRWIVRNRIYLIAFAIPAALTYLAYAIFGLYPFGEESVLCLDLNGQYVYYFEALRDAFWGDGSIFYNWSRNLSGEFMGIIGYYLASPFTLIVMLLPEKFMLSSLLIMQLCKVGAAGVTFNYFLQKRRNVQPYPSLLFSTMYSMMAYMVIQLIDPMWLDGLVFLPLIMLGIEYLVDDGRRLNYIIPLALMCVANFYIGYMICIFCGTVLLLLPAGRFGQAQGL